MAILGIKPFRNSKAESQRDSGSKPRVARNELPWESGPPTHNPNGVVANPWKLDTTPLGLKTNPAVTQGGSCLATLDWRTQSLWDCKTADCSRIPAVACLAGNFRKALRLGLVALCFTRPAEANPAGMTVQSGSATISVNGSQFSINAGNNAHLNWQSFNIASGEKTIFNQPSASSIVWNRVNDPNPSQIYGSLQANGVVVLLNSSGFYFGPNSFVGAAGLVVSTANCLPPQNAGGSWEFNGPPPLASIINYGTIKVGNGGSAFLIADKVENHGDIEAPGGSIGFAAGQTVTLSERPDGRGMSMNVKLPQGSVNNFGNLIADGGTVALNARVVNQDGLIQANSVQNNHGIIELVAGDDLSLGANSKINATGDDTITGSAGGRIVLKSDNFFRDANGSEIATAGGTHGGNGGDIEVSAPNILSLRSAMDARAQRGFTGGEFLLDPVNLILGTSGNGTVPADGTVAYNSSPGTLNLNVNTAFANKNFSNIKLQASGDITVSDNTVWDLTASTSVGSGQLSLQAGANIILNNGAKILDPGGWSVALAAGYDFINGVNRFGIGSISLNNGSSIETAQGGISLTAGKDITVGSGHVITKGGGGIDASALQGNINTGTDAQGYVFKFNANSITTAYDLSHGLGGISTAAGGNVNLTAGGDVSSWLPVAGISEFLTGGAGAYGKQAGDVNIVAGGNVTGHYLVANGTGSIFAGVKKNPDGTLNLVKDSSGKYELGTTGSAGTDLNANFVLSLINGGWNVSAAQNIYLSEVRNPNGLFNVSGATAVKNLFDYAPEDFVNLWAGNAVRLGGTGLLRVNNQKIPVIYPGSLRVNAGAGGVTLVGTSDPFNKLILFPSPQGSLVINTTDGGSLSGALSPIAATGAQQIFNLIVSDSGSSQFVKNQNPSTFLGDHANTPIHLNHPTDVKLNISGDMSLVTLFAPEAAQISVGGNMNNCGFQAINLVGNSSITVGGDIINRSSFTSVDLSHVIGLAAPNMNYLARYVAPKKGDPNYIDELRDVSSADLINSFHYDPKTKFLTYQYDPKHRLLDLDLVRHLPGLLDLLQNLTVQKVDRFGHLLWLDLDQSVPDTEVVHVFDSATRSALQTEFIARGPNVLGTSGYFIGGGGKLEITARSLDLATTPGIQSKGAGFYRNNSGYPLANLFTHGADIDIHLDNTLNMVSSSIASLNGGDISITAGGDVNVGSSGFSVPASVVRGIFTSSQGNVSVVADGDINVNGSRIGAYDGGNVTVKSINGDINAGTGGLGYVQLTAYYVNPLTHQLESDSPTIPGSGIFATTFPPRSARYQAPRYTVGNILVEALNGSINASAAGIIQLPLNNTKNPQATVTVLAGYELRDSNGDPVTAANITSGTAVKISDGHNIVASGSGVIAQNAALKASGKIDGVIFSRGNLDVSAVGNINVTALAQGNVNVNSGGNISGTIIGVGGITASGGSIDASLLSQNISASGDSSGATKGFAQGTAANAASVGASNNEETKIAKTSDTTEEEDLKKKKPVSIALAQKVSRVTVILPATETKTPKL